MDDRTVAGTAATREFYDREGWKRADGKLKDQALFGVKNDGPIRVELHQLRCDRIREALGGPGLKLMECGCGGSPATYLGDLASHLTVVDFSQTGLTEAAQTLRQSGVEFDTVAADMCHLPFDNESFDAAFSAHAIYHIDSAAAQAKAFSEIMRVVRKGGSGVFVLANPYPLMFPLRFARRTLASVPGVSALLNRVRSKPPLPYLPMRLGWMRRQLQPWGTVRIIGYRMASTAMNQNVPETSGVGRQLWRLMRWVETRYPRAAARLGNYVTIIVRKH
ncbi:MAG: class I SAM-dependent methyltransferase [Tepidisphaeraceae bacterium]